MKLNGDSQFVIWPIGGRSNEYIGDERGTKQWRREWDLAGSLRLAVEIHRLDGTITTLITNFFLNLTNIGGSYRWIGVIF